MQLILDSSKSIQRYLGTRYLKENQLYFLSLTEDATKCLSNISHFSIADKIDARSLLS